MWYEQKHIHGIKKWDQFQRIPLQQIIKNNNCQIFQDRCLQFNYPYGDYKLSRPEEIQQKSIFTENDHLERTRTLQKQQEEEDDIYRFIQSSKTLKERIYEKLYRNKKNTKNHRQIIEETTFRPNLKKIRTQQNACRIKTQRSIDNNQKRHINNRRKADNVAWWLKENQQDTKIKLSQLSFHERQQKTIKNKQQLYIKLKEQKQKQQISQCTFKPKLTKYKKIRN